MTPATDPAVLDELQAACSELAAGRPRMVIARVEALGADGGSTGEAIGSVAHGLRLEAAGRIEDAMAHMERAMDIDVALPELLDTLARFFLRVGQHDRAHHALVSLDTLAPGASADLVYRIPPDERARFGAWAIRGSMTVHDPDLYGLLDYKTALVDRHGVAGAAMILAATNQPGQRRRATTMPLRRLIDHARERGQEYVEAIPATTVQARWPRVLGESLRPAYTARSRTLFTAVLEDVVVSGKSNVLLTSDEALHDVQGDELARIPVDLRVDPLVSAVDGDRVIVSAPVDRTATPTIPEAVWLGGVHSGAFGHWITEFLPKVWALSASHGDIDVPVIVDRQMPPQHLEALRFFVDGVQLTILEPGEQVRVDRLWVGSQLMYMPVGPLPGIPARKGDGVIDANGLLQLLRPLRARLEALDTGGTASHLYLPRPAAGRRQLEGQGDLEAEVVRRGYTPVHLEDLDFAEQVRAVRGARRIVAPDGSALMMTLFGQRGLRIGVLVHPYLEEFEWYAQACEALGHELTVVTGSVTREDPRYRTFSDFRIDRTAVARLLDALDQAPDA